MYSHIEKVLGFKASNYIHGFRSGGGLRVLRLEGSMSYDISDSLLGYGEYIQFEGALASLEEDLKAGGGTYVSQYLTGTNEVSSLIDLWLLRGRDFDIRKYHHGDQPYEFSSTFTQELDFREYHDTVQLTGKPVRFEKDGISYLFKKSEYLEGTSGSCVRNDSGLDPWFRPMKISYRAATLASLLEEVNKKLTYWLGDKNEIQKVPKNDEPAIFGKR